jgi:hypothetical protein
MIHCIRLFAVIMAGLLLTASDATGASIAVPSSLEMVSKSNAIALVELRVRKDGGVDAKVKEVLKGKPTLAAKTVQLYMEPDSIRRKIHAMVTETPGKTMLVLGMWSEEKEVLVLSFGLSSLWPDWAREEVSPSGTLEECRAYPSSVGKGSP